jgi:hypothetical protein
MANSVSLVIPGSTHDLANNLPSDVEYLRVTTAYYAEIQKFQRLTMQGPGQNCHNLPRRPKTEISSATPLVYMRHRVLANNPIRRRHDQFVTRLELLTSIVNSSFYVSQRR